MFNHLARRTASKLASCASVALLLGALAGCQGPAEAEPPPGEETTSELAQALTLNTAGPYGSTSGTTQNPGTNMLSAVTKIQIWSDTNFVYGIKLFWGTKSVLYGDISHGTMNAFMLGKGEVIGVVYVSVDGTGWLRGIAFSSFLGGLESGGIYGGYLGNGLTTVFDGPGLKWSDMTAYTVTDLRGWKVLCGLKVHYLSP